MRSTREEIHFEFNGEHYSLPTASAEIPYDPNRRGMVPKLPAGTFFPQDFLRLEPKVHDTLPAAVASKYYPWGPPNDMSPYHSSLSYFNQRVMGQVREGPVPQSEEEKEEKCKKDLQNW
jgi:hypothetical protein